MTGDLTDVSFPSAHAMMRLRSSTVDCMLYIGLAVVDICRVFHHAGSQGVRFRFQGLWFIVELQQDVDADHHDETPVLRSARILRKLEFPGFKVRRRAV